MHTLRDSVSPLLWILDNKRTVQLLNVRAIQKKNIYIYCSCTHLLGHNITGKDYHANFTYDYKNTKKISQFGENKDASLKPPFEVLCFD